MSNWKSSKVVVCKVKQNADLVWKDICDWQKFSQRISICRQDIAGFPVLCVKCTELGDGQIKWVSSCVNDQSRELAWNNCILYDYVALNAPKVNTMQCLLCCPSNCASVGEITRVPLGEGFCAFAHFTSH